jgi:flagellar FliL protein
LAEEKPSADVKEKSGFDFKIILLGLFLFLAVMGATYFILRSLISPLLPPEPKNKAVEVQAGNLVSVGELTTNINDVGGTRFLKVEVFVEVADKKHQNKVTEFIPVIRDSILTILSSQTMADLDVHNRDHLKAVIKKDLNKKIGGEIITNVYFSNFIMQ